MNKWKIKIDDTKHNLINASRPNINIEENKQPDGSFLPGKTTWLPITIATNNKLSWTGKKDVDVIICNEQDKELESFTLLDAEINGCNINFLNVKYLPCN